MTDISLSNLGRNAKTNAAQHAGCVLTKTPPQARQRRLYNRRPLTLPIFLSPMPYRDCTVFIMAQWRTMGAPVASIGNGVFLTCSSEHGDRYRQRLQRSILTAGASPDWGERIDRLTIFFIHSCEDDYNEQYNPYQYSCV